MYFGGSQRSEVMGVQSVRAGSWQERILEGKAGSRSAKAEPAKELGSPPESREQLGRWRTRLNPCLCLIFTL